jgi:hypothetical protein
MENTDIEYTQTFQFIFENAEKIKKIFHDCVVKSAVLNTASMVRFKISDRKKTDTGCHLDVEVVDETDIFKNGRTSISLNLHNLYDADLNQFFGGLLLTIKISSDTSYDLISTMEIPHDKLTYFHDHLADIIEKMCNVMTDQELGKNQTILQQPYLLYVYDVYTLQGKSETNL